jgi:hypothetical protein
VKSRDELSPDTAPSRFAAAAIPVRMGRQAHLTRQYAAVDGIAVDDTHGAAIECRLLDTPPAMMRMAESRSVPLRAGSFCVTQLCPAQRAGAKTNMSGPMFAAPPL